MDESAQQAVQLGVNVTIFIVALSISITLLLGVRDVAEKALKYDASLSTGSRVVSVGEAKKRLVNGDELLSYYTRYMSEQARLTASGKYIITIENKSGSSSITQDTSMKKNHKNQVTETLKEFFDRKNININSQYEVITTRYNSDSEIVEILFKEV